MLVLERMVSFQIGTHYFEYLNTDPQERASAAGWCRNWHALWQGRILRCQGINDFAIPSQCRKYRVFFMAVL